LNLEIFPSSIRYSDEQRNSLLINNLEMWINALKPTRFFIYPIQYTRVIGIVRLYTVKLLNNTVLALLLSIGFMPLGLAGSPLTFSATGYGAATQIAVQAGNNQTAAVGEAVAIAPSVIVRDADNKPVAGVSVTFTVGVGGGSISPASPATVTTDANGIAALTSWTLGSALLGNTLTATATGLTGSPVTFTANGTLPDPCTASYAGCDWTIRESAADNAWLQVAYGRDGNGNGLWVAVASSGTGNRVMTSPDGINWTTRSSAADRSWVSVAYGNGLWVAVAFDGGGAVMTSPDGISWTMRDRPSTNTAWHSVAYGNGLWVAVATTGTNRVMTSPDGITWTSQAAAAANSWHSVAYANGLWWLLPALARATV